MSNRKLKIKLFSLQEEAKYIRKHERKVLGSARYLKKERVNDQSSITAYDEYEDLHHHRTDVLRKASRACNVAYAFLRGKKYTEVETVAKGNVYPRDFSHNFIRLVTNNINKFGVGNTDYHEVKRWIQDDCLEQVKQRTHEALDTTEVQTVA